MTFAQSIRHCLSNYATFKGRASRSEYWWFMLFFFLLLIVAVGIAVAIAMLSGPAGDQRTLVTMISLAPWVVVIPLLMPLWAVGVRRFHDRDLTGWHYLGLALAGAIPYVGFLASIATMVITAMKGTPGPNRFGPDPLTASAADVFA